MLEKRLVRRSSATPPRRRGWGDRKVPRWELPCAPALASASPRSRRTLLGQPPCGVSRDGRDRGCLLSGRKVDSGLDLELDAVVDVQEQRARVLHAPLDVGDLKPRRGCRLPGGRVDLDGEKDLVIRAVELEQAVEVPLRVPVGRKPAFEPVGTKHGRRETAGLEDLLAHPPVAGGVSALAALHVHDDFAPNLSRYGIESECAALQLETAVHRVEGGAE